MLNERKRIDDRSRSGKSPVNGKATVPTARQTPSASVTQTLFEVSGLQNGIYDSSVNRLVAKATQPPPSSNHQDIVKDVRD
jgi:hypothetical protein